MSDDDDYEVGYKKPPKPTQFKKGQSGNPKGRPKGTKNFKTDLLEEFGESVQVNEGGNIHRLSKQRAILKRTVERALKGNERAAELLVKWHRLYIGTEEYTEATKSLSADDQAIIDRYIADLQQSGTDDDPDKDA